MTQEIYISEWLEKDYKDVYNQLLRVLAEFDITPKTLPYSEEVWCRDYMPIHIGEGKYVGFNFRRIEKGLGMRIEPEEASALLYKIGNDIPVYTIYK